MANSDFTSDVVPITPEKRVELYNKTMELRREKGWGWRRIAKRLNIPPGTVNDWLYKGKKPKPVLNLEPSATIAYILGVVLGDGAVSHSKKWSDYKIQLHVKDKEFAACFYEALKKIKLNPCFCYREDRDQHVVSAHSKQFYDWFKKLSLSNIKSIVQGYEKYFIKGFYESEGSFYTGASHHTIRMYNTKKNLISFVRRLLSKLGFQSSLHLGRTKLGDVYTLRLLGGKKAARKFLILVKPCIYRKSISAW